MSRVTVYVRPAKDYFWLNLDEARTLSKVYSAFSERVLGEEAFFELSEENALRLISRLCGSRDAGIHVGEFKREELSVGLVVASKIVGGRRYKVQVQPEGRELIREVVERLGPNVDVRNPEAVVFVRDEGGKLTLRVRFPTARVRLSLLQPKNWAYFHPGALQPFFCGLMCNLTACGDNALLLDPFCGVGSTLVAASKLGFRAIGLDLSKKQVYGCRRNLKQLGLENAAGVVRADAACPPLKSDVFDGAVFDPPYGRASSLFGRRFEELLDKVAEALWAVLKPNAGLCFFVPSGSGALDCFRSRGFKLTLTFPIRVHSKLTRLLVVAQKVV